MLTFSSLCLVKQSYTVLPSRESVWLTQKKLELFVKCIFKQQTFMYCSIGLDLDGISKVIQNLLLDAF